MFHNVVDDAVERLNKSDAATQRYLTSLELMNQTNRALLTRNQQVKYMNMTSIVAKWLCGVKKRL